MALTLAFMKIVVTEGAEKATNGSGSRQDDSDKYRPFKIE